MKLNFTSGKLIVRFTLNFIVHQILLLLFVSIPAAFYIVILGQPERMFYVNLTTWLIIAAYLVYCLFYGYYVARPMADILMKIGKLSSGEYRIFPEKKGLRLLSGRLYREVYANLETLSKILQENEQKRQEFEKSRQDWAAGVTHDLKTPLSYISGYTDMLLSEEYEWNPDEKREFLQLIKDKSAYMKELIDDLGLAFRMDSEIGMSFSPQIIELVELIRRVVAETANLPSARGFNFEILGEEGPHYIMGDAGLLRRAFSNLLVNAVVHNPAGTAIQVNIVNHAGLQNGIGIEKQYNVAERGIEPPFLEIQIWDNGRGMEEESIAHLFDRYYRGTSTDTPAGGTGLGMAIVKQIITAHQGTIKVESKANEGTSVLIWLPN